jgi:hypothetical protein
MSAGRSHGEDFQSPLGLTPQQVQMMARQREMRQLKIDQQSLAMPNEKVHSDQARNDANTQARFSGEPYLNIVAGAESPNQRINFATDLPKTISPDHALLDYSDGGFQAYAQPPLQQSQSSIIPQRPSMLNSQSDETSSSYLPQLSRPSSGFPGDLTSPLHDIAVDYQMPPPLLEENIQEYLSTKSLMMSNGQIRDFAVHDRLKSLLRENSATQQAQDQSPVFAQTQVSAHDRNLLASTSHQRNSQAEIEYQQSAHAETEALIQQHNEFFERPQREWTLPTFPTPTLLPPQNIPDAPPTHAWQIADNENMLPSYGLSREDAQVNFAKSVAERTSQPGPMPRNHLGSSELRDSRKSDIPEVAFDNYGSLRRNASVNQQFYDLEEEDDGQIDCICGFNEDNGNTVACDTCNTWQHIICYYPQYGDSLPDELQHWCVKCRPEISVNAQAAHISQREARADRYGLQNSNKRQKNSERHKKKTKNAAGVGLTRGWPRDKSRFDDPHPDDRYVSTEQRSNNPSPPTLIPRASHYTSPHGEDGFKASDDVATTLKASEVRSGRDALEMLCEAAVLGRVDSSAITQRPSYEPHNHTSEAPDHASLDASLWTSQGFYEDSPSPPTEPEATHSFKEVPGEDTLQNDFNNRRIPKDSANSPLRRGKQRTPKERLMRRIGACLYCRQRRVKCEPGTIGCLRCDKVNRPCEHRDEIGMFKQAEYTRQKAEIERILASDNASNIKHKEQPPVPNLLSGADQETLQSFFHSNDPSSSGDQESLDRRHLLDASGADQSELQSKSRLEETRFVGSANA